MSDTKSFIGCHSIFATRLRELMTENKTTQQRLADSMGITRQAIAQYMDGTVQPNIEKLYKLTEFFNVSADYLLGRSNAKTQDENIKIICDITGLSENVVSQLKDYRVEVQRKCENGIVATGTENVKPPKDVSRIIESRFFWSLVNNLWVLKNIRKEDTDFPLRLKNLRDVLSVFGFREYIINALKYQLEGFINNVAPYERADGDDRVNLHVDGNIDILDELPIGSRIYLDEKNAD